MRYFRKIIQIRASDSPNVARGLDMQARGLEPDDLQILPGVLSWSLYDKRRKTWDKVSQCVGLDAQWYEGEEVLLYPPDWLNLAARTADELKASGRRRVARSMGIDPGEGGDATVWAIIDGLGLIHLLSMQTPDTAMITSKTLALMREYNLKPEDVVFDRGGGGKQHADRLAQQGHAVRTVGFGEAVAPEPKHGRVTIANRIDAQEDKYAYKNRRAQMYGELRLLLDPQNDRVFAIPAEYTELRRQLAPIPKWEDEEGRLYLPPKQRKTADKMKPSTQVTMNTLIGCSPDCADALVLAVHGLLHRIHRPVATVHY